MQLDRAACDRARKSRDARFDGRFFIAVITTKIYCRPICPARSPNDQNVRYYPTAAAAETAGFRPCLRCRPEASPGTPAWFGTSSVVSRALRMIGDGALDRESVDRFADRLGVTSRHLRRLFVQHLGATPIDVALTRRVQSAKKLLDETQLPFAQVAIAAGFGSLRRFNGEMRRTYARTPTQLRRLACLAGARSAAGERRRAKRPIAESDCYRFRLCYRPPYDWESLIAFLSARATPGVEFVDRSGYRRTIAINGKAGSIAIAPVEGAPVLSLEVRFADANMLLSIVERAKRMFDVAADPAVIAEQLSVDPLLRRACSAHGGIRVPGAWDPFELAVRAILGQQISVRAATTIAGRVASRWGSPAATGNGLDRLFPSPAQLQDARIEDAGVIASRAGAIRALARAVCSGTLTFDGPAVVDALRAIPGIGEWTAQYVAMRALNEPDAFPSGDLVLRRMAGNCSARELEARSECWRPWRAYAVLLLWQTANDLNQPIRRTRHAHVDSGRIDRARGRNDRVTSAIAR
jgi:AraC family transcriptional regulator, regulatory protein of adaptative response / DNA-3-methyladenine glycosylase II